MDHNDARVISRQLRDKEQIIFYEKIFSSLNAIVFVFDLVKYKMVWTNDAFKKLLGYKKSTKSIPQDVLLDIYHPDDRDVLKQMYAFFRQNNSGDFTAIYKFRNIHGKYLWLCTSASLFRKTSDGKVFEIVGVSIDFTQQLTYNKNIKLISQEKIHKMNEGVIQRITKRERQILKLFANGQKTKEIAEDLDLSFHTVNNHRKNILKKLQLKNIASLVNFAVENGLA